MNTRQIAKRKSQNRKGLEFKKAVKVEMFLRAGGPEKLRCEECGLQPKGRNFEYDHTVELWELPSDLREQFKKDGVPATYGKLLCIPCHDEKSGEKASERAHCNLIIENAANARKQKSRPIPGSKASGWKHTMRGEWVRR